MGELNLCYGCMGPKNSDGICSQCGFDENAELIPNALALGTMLHDRYMVGKVLEHNGEGMTYLAYDTTIGCKVLIREYLPVQLCNRVEDSTLVNVNGKHLAQYKSLMAEYTELNKALARQRSLVHLNPALDLFAENNTTYAVYEFLEGRNLLAYLKENAGELSWREVAGMFPPLFTTMGILHNSGVLHRGISPETIYVTDKGDIKLNGFCISAVRTNDTELEAELFDGYAAPEQYFANRQQGSWTDVYGICAVLYRILTGCRPTAANARLSHDNLISPHDLNGRIPQVVSDAIMKGLALDANQRVRTITDLVTMLFETGDNLEKTTVVPVQQHINATTTFRTVPTAQSGSTTVMNKPIVSNGGNRPQRSGNKQQPHSKNGTAANKSSSKKQSAPPIDQKKQKQQELFEQLRGPLVIIILLLLILILIIVAIQAMTHDNQPESSLSQTMPVTNNVVQTPPDESSSTFYNDGFVPYLVGMNFQIKKDALAGWLELEPIYEYNDEFTKDTIFEQEYPENTGFQSGSTVMQVKVSLGSAIKSLPDFRGMTRQAYLAKLKDMGFVEAKEDNSAPTNKNQKTTKPAATTTTSTETTGGVDQKVLYRSKVDYNYTNGYVCAVEPEIGTEIDVQKSYTIIVYYAENPDPIYKVTKPKTTTTGVGGTKTPTTKTTVVGTKPSGGGEDGTKVPNTQAPTTKPPAPETQAPPPPQQTQAPPPHDPGTEEHE